MEKQLLLQLLRKKKGLLLVILDLTQSEQTLPIEALENLLRQKKTLLSCIEKVDHQIKEFRHSFASILPQEIQKELFELREVITQILDTDKVNYLAYKKELGIYDGQRV